jgi:hypothetical protein
MHIPGHLAVALVQYRLVFPRTRKRKIAYILLLTSLLPDAIDKSIGYLLHLMPNGRHYAHNIFSLLGSSVVVSLVGGRLAGQAWFIGYLGHLLADSYGLVPWLFPLKSYPFERGKLTFESNHLFRELPWLILAAVVLRRTR